ncbi:MAG: hypothetical protein ACBZ72_06240 [Candidatus Bathyarchaeia archaeon]
MSKKARVFISCGQRKDSQEVEIAEKIRDKLIEMGFEPYIAVTEQTLRGVKENIFTKLRSSEYFLFIDFKREKLFKEHSFEDTGVYRGSLFSHQELAIATFQDYEVLAFQEESVKKDDGLLKFIQTNCIPFTDFKSLPNLVSQKVKERNWNPKWRNELGLDRDENNYENADAPQVGAGRYYHIKVVNKHKDKIARNCFAYIERIRNLATGNERILELVELKWRGVIKETVSIVPQAVRYLDALHINFSTPTVAYLGLNPFIFDWTGYLNAYQISGTGDYEIDYVVFSEDFPPCRGKFMLHIDAQIQNTTLEKI